MLLPSSSDYSSHQATSNLDARNVADGASTEMSGQSANDIFVGYERMQFNAAFPTSATASKPIRRSSTVQGEAIGFLHPRPDDWHGETIEWGAHDDRYVHARHRSNLHKADRLLVTASPFRLTTGSKRVDGLPASLLEQVSGEETSVEGKGEYYRHGREESETAGRTRPATGRPPPTPAQGQAPTERLSTAVSFPLLVFDTQTFLALGELDERFAFQGGIADWISRANMASSDQGVGINADVAGCSCDASPYRHCRSPRRASTSRGTETVSSCSYGAVMHVHERGWGKRFVRQWPECDVQPTCPTSEEPVPGGSSPNLNRHRDEVRSSRDVERALRLQGADGNGFYRRRDFEDSRTREDIIIDQRTIMPLAELEVLVQADADLFFLPLLLSPSLGEIWRIS